MTTAIGEDLTVTNATGRDATHYPIVLAAAPVAEGLSLTFKYRPDLYDEETIAGFAGMVERVLAAMAEDAGAVGRGGPWPMRMRRCWWVRGCVVVVGPVGPVTLVELLAAGSWIWVVRRWCAASRCLPTKSSSR